MAPARAYAPLLIGCVPPRGRRAAALMRKANAEWQQRLRWLAQGGGLNFEAKDRISCCRSPSEQNPIRPLSLSTECEEHD
jgi:hypothetical protein